MEFSPGCFKFKFKSIEFKNSKMLVESLNRFLKSSNGLFNSSPIDIQIIYIDCDYMICIVKLVYLINYFNE